MIKKIFSQKWRLAFKVIPFVIVIIFLKFIVHYFGIEFLTLNALFTALISANVFLVGFLISGVLVDYKEGEKIPGDLAASLETMTDEGLIIYKSKKDIRAKEYLKRLEIFTNSILNWFYKKERTHELGEKLRQFNDDFFNFEALTQANFIVRLKQEQNLLRKMIMRIHTIRETSFNASGYAIAEIITFFISVGLIFLVIDPFYESIFFVIFVSFILVYMVLLIKDLDNPFGYYQEEALAEEVSLKPLIDFQKKIKAINDNLN
jgi:hypothetical protein